MIDLVNINFTENKEDIQINICITKNGSEATKQVIFDSTRCNGLLFAYQDKLEINTFIEALSNAEVPEYFDIIKLDDKDVSLSDSNFIEYIDDIINDNTKLGITTVLVVEDASIIDSDFFDLMRIRRDGFVKLFTFIDEKSIDSKTGKIKDRNLSELDDPFIFQIIIYLNDMKNVIYNTDLYYNDRSKIK